MLAIIVDIVLELYTKIPRATIFTTQAYHKLCYQLMADKVQIDAQIMCAIDTVELSGKNVHQYCTLNIYVQTYICTYTLHVYIVVGQQLFRRAIYVLRLRARRKFLANFL